MQITEKLRTEIALSLPKLGISEAEKIKKETGLSTDTVYREWRKIMGREKGKTMMDHPVVMALAELAISRKEEKKAVDKRISRITKQLSAA